MYKISDLVSSISCAFMHVLQVTRSTDNRGPMTEERYLLLLKVLQGNPYKESTVETFAVQNKKFIYSNGNKCKPNFVLKKNLDNEEAIFRVSSSKESSLFKEFIHAKKAREIILKIHKPEGKECLPLGITKLMHIFNQRYTINGCQKLITDTLRNCTGSCKLTKCLNAASPPPKPVSVMERIQIDLLQMYGSKSPLCTKSSHNYRLIMSVMDCFSKYCWLIPLCTKTATEVARALCSIFREFGCPNIVQSDNGTEFIANIVTTVCSSLGITTIHGRPYHPQSQGQVERLNQKVKKFLAARLLTFSPDQQSNVWPWLLPEIAHYLNNTWHSSINEVPFTAFYGRESGHFGPASSGLWPDDNLYFLLLNHCSCIMQAKESTQQIIKETTNDARADQFCLDEEDDGTCSDAKNCCSIESVVEAASHFSSINAVRREIEVSIFNATERSAIKNQQAHMKKFQLRKFQCNEKVIFHNPHIHGMVVIPNQVGDMISELPGGYYEIKYDESGSEHRVRLHSSTIVPYKYPETLNLISGVSNKSLVSAETLRDEVLTYAETQRQHYFKNKLHISDNDLLIVNELTLTSILHITRRMDLNDRDDPDAFIDLYCYACDCFIVSNVTTDFSLKEQCKKHHNFIIHFLSNKKFVYFLTALYCWQLSRAHNILPLLYAIQNNSENPAFIGYNHICVGNVFPFRLTAIISVVMPG